MNFGNALHIMKILASKILVLYRCYPTSVFQGSVKELCTITKWKLSYSCIIHITSYNAEKSEYNTHDSGSIRSNLCKSLCRWLPSQELTLSLQQNKKLPCQLSCIYQVLHWLTGLVIDSQLCRTWSTYAASDMMLMSLLETYQQSLAT